MEASAITRLKLITTVGTPDRVNWCFLCRVGVTCERVIYVSFASAGSGPAPEN